MEDYGSQICMFYRTLPSWLFFIFYITKIYSFFLHDRPPKGNNFFNKNTVNLDKLFMDTYNVFMLINLYLYDGNQIHKLVHHVKKKILKIGNNYAHIPIWVILRLISVLIIQKITH